MATVVVVCGGRVGIREDMVKPVLERVFSRYGGDIEIIEGDAPGYDRAAGEWARRKGVPSAKFHINDDIDGSDEIAPKRRNARMLRDGRPDVCLGFPGAGGTRHMMTICQEAGVAVLDVEFPDAGGFLLHAWPAAGTRKGGTPCPIRHCPNIARNGVMCSRHFHRLPVELTTQLMDTCNPRGPRSAEHEAVIERCVALVQEKLDRKAAA